MDGQGRQDIEMCSKHMFMFIYLRINWIPICNKPFQAWTSNTNMLDKWPNDPSVSKEIYRRDQRRFTSDLLLT